MPGFKQEVLRGRYPVPKRLDLGLLRRPRRVTRLRALTARGFSPSSLFPAARCSCLVRRGEPGEHRVAADVRSCKFGV